MHDAIIGKKHHQKFDPLFCYLDLLSTPPSDEIVEPKATINARRLYRSCIDESAIEREDLDKMRSFINKEFGGWADIHDSSHNIFTLSLTDLLLKLNQYNIFTFFQVQAVVDLDNLETLRYRIRVSISP